MNKVLANEELDTIKIIKIVFAEKKLISFGTFIFALISIIISLNIPNTYTSSALLAPTSADESLSSKLTSYSALAGFAGINLPQENTSDLVEAIERIKSIEFFSKHILPNIKLENLVASKNWSQPTNKIIYDKDIFDVKEKKWIRKASYPNKVIPSEQEAFKFYKEQVSISQDKKNLFVTLKVDHHSPFIAKTWTELIIEKINSSMKEEDIIAAQKAIKFLNDSQATTNIQSLKDATSRLLEAQMQTLMLASSSDTYVFKIINSPIVSEYKSSPNRVLICLFISLFGFIISIFFALIKNYLKELDA
jgi:LPS O-antigen subunit length determinant protein (WzzB/FepE family)